MEILKKTKDLLASLADVTEAGSKIAKFKIEVARGFDSQYDFQRQVWRGLGYKVDSWPNYVELWERTGDLRYWPDMSQDQGNQGTLRLGGGQPAAHRRRAGQGGPGRLRPPVPRCGRAQGGR